jgi:hypothetical protein
VLVTETDDNTATGVIVNGTMILDIRKDPKGGPSRISFGVVSKYCYHDLDGDGDVVWDAWCDSRGDYRKCFIRRDEGWVQVCDSKGGLVGDGPELSLDRKTEYVWDGKAWTSRPVDR